MKTILIKKSLLFLMSMFILFSIGTSHASSVVPANHFLDEQLAQLEKNSSGRIGIYAVNTGNDQKLQYRADERFPFCSTGKVMVVSAVLQKAETDSKLLQKKIIYTQQDIKQSEYAPITEKLIGIGMSVAELSKAAMEYSDNAALNLLMNLLGGPDVINSYARSVGDYIFRIDRFEPELNSAIPGDQRDTTTPSAMGNSLLKLTVGNALQPSQRAMLLDWMKNNTTGNFKIRAGVPKNWVVGDKTGHGQYNTTDDIGIIWPPHCDPIIMVIYFTENKSDSTDRSNIIASAANLIISEFAQHDQCIKKQFESDTGAIYS